MLSNINGHKIRLIDSLNASLAQGILAIYASEMRDKGMSVDEASLYVMEQIQKKSKYEILSTLPMISAPEGFHPSSSQKRSGFRVLANVIAVFTAIKGLCIIDIKIHNIDFRMVFPQVISQNINIFAPSPMDQHKILSINTLPIQQEKPAIPPFQTVSQASFTLRHDKHYVLILYIYNADLPRVILIPLFRTE